MNESYTTNTPAVKQVSTPRVYSRRKGAETPPPDAVYVGRPSEYGNPFNLPYARATQQQRQTVIDQFRAYAVERLRDEPDWLKPLRGKSLVCWCAPLPCHADVLLEMANAESEAADALL